MPRKQTPAPKLLSLLLAILLIASYAQYALLRPLAPVVGTVSFQPKFHTASAVAPLVWPAYGEAAIGASGYGVLATHGPQQPLPTASVIKTLTALAVLKQKPLAGTDSGPLITITQDDVDSYHKFLSEDGSVAQVSLGEQLSERQALEALMLPSANNMAETLARWAFGSLASYLSYANSYALTLGMTNTTVTDPSGFASTTTSTPGDLVLLGEAALANAALAQIVNEPSASIPATGTIYNMNGLIGQDGIIGVKTGNNDANPGCYLFAANREVDNRTVTVVGVVMNGPDLHTAMLDSLPLLSSATKALKYVPVIPAMVSVGTYDLPWMGMLSAINNRSLAILTWHNSNPEVHATLQPLTGYLPAGSTVGQLTLTDAATGKTYSTPLTLRQTASVPNIWWRLAHPLAARVARPSR